MDDEFEDEAFCPSYPWSWKQALVAAGDLAANVLQASADFVEHISIQIAASCNHDVEQRHFRDEVAREIESITKEE